MDFDSTVYIAIGIVLIVLGILTWKKQMVSILHAYHYKNVKKEDIPFYTRLMGIGQIVIGIGLCLTGMLRILTYNILSYSPFIAGFIIGLIIMHKAQIKYNGTWFS